jgi:fermentation-respiration switch protein FrsA (DUF1100 family)
MRTDIEFQSHGVTCRGWHYAPQVAGPAPGIVMSHGLSAVKEMGLAPFAESFAEAGFHVLVFDYRCLGGSDGNERGRMIPQEQHDDLRSAIGCLTGLPGVDPERIGLWGTSYSGGHALFLGALDPRVKVIVAQAPAIDLAGSLIGLAGRDGFAGYLALLAEDQAARSAGQAGGRLAIVAPEGEPCLLPTPDSLEWFDRLADAPGARWENDTSLESVARMAEYQPASLVHLAGKPILMLAGDRDSLIPVQQVRDAFARAAEPKRLEVFDGGHFDFYPGRAHHDRAAGLAAAWFSEHLRVKP